MIVVVFSWIIIFVIFFTWGFSVTNLIQSLVQQKENNHNLNIDEYFFMGFFTISLIAGILSLFIPLGKIVFIALCILTVALLLIHFKSIIHSFFEYESGFFVLTKFEKAGLILLVLMIFTAVVNKITFEDTLTYHAQNIQWIQKYAVIPGLGNIHGRFAFNNMFFTISSIFSFQIKDSLIFPLNGLSYLVLAIKLSVLYRKENIPGTKWEGVFYILMLLISLLILLPNLNTPAPDIICNILIIYAFVIIFRYKVKNQSSIVHFILINLLIFSCITYKISSLFLMPAFLFFVNSGVLKKLTVSFIIGLLILVPFLIRNYYLSGYIIYPFPAIDIFNVDWKIPIADVKAMKLEIESFAKLKGVAYDIVKNMQLREWIFQWFQSRDFNTKFILIINIFSVLSLIIMFIKREFFLAMIQLLILLNLVFWISTAPDPRFAYGFLFAGFALTFAYLVKFIEFSNHSKMLRFLKVLITCVFIIIIARRIKFPLETIKDPSLLIVPASFQTVETITYKTNFEYRVPVNEGEWCYNAEIPCVTYSLDNIFMRGTSFKEGFRTEISK